MKTLTHDRLRELLDYNPETGIFTWKEPNKHCSKNIKGTKAGSLNSKGYRRIRVEGKDYKAHRLAWFYVYGSLPSGMLDHKNRVRDDNRIDNLRLATPTLNAFNKEQVRVSRTGVRGVFKHGKRYMAYIGRNAETRASFPSLEEAVIARKAMESGILELIS